VTTDNRTRQFLPYNLLDDFNGAYITDNNGNKRPLVKQQRIAVKGYEKAEDDMTPVTPMMCGIMLFILSVAIVLIEIRSRKTFVIWDAILMSTLGIAGIILLALFCSLHPTTSTNLLILVVNPIHLIYIYTVVKRKKTHYWKMMTALCVAFFIGAIWQDYASGMIFVILSLLSRCIIHITTEKKLHNEI
jgi:hypothetical protein